MRCERLAEALVCKIFNTHLLQSFISILRESGEIESRLDHSQPPAALRHDDSSIYGNEATEAVKKHLGGRAPGVDEVRTEFLKALDIIGLSWLKHLQCCVEIKDDSSGLLDSGGGSRL